MFKNISGFAFCFLNFYLVTSRIETQTTKKSKTEHFVATVHGELVVFAYNEGKRHEFDHFSTTLAVNSTLSMTCNKDSSTHKGFIWWFNGSVIASSITTPGGLGFHNVKVWMSNTTSRLDVREMQINNTGLYRCNVGNTTVMEHFLEVTAPELILYCKGVECPTSISVNTSETYILHCYCNQLPLANPIWWEINGRREVKESFFLNNSLSPKHNRTFHLCSTLVYDPDKNDDNVSCVMGPSTYDYINIKRLHGMERYSLKVLLIIVCVVSLHVTVIISLVIACNVCKKRRGSTTIQSSIQTIYSHRRSTIRKVKLQHFGTIETSPKIADIPLTPICDTWRKFMLNPNIELDLKLHSCRSEDEVDLFWEATFMDKNIKDRFVVRSISGKAAIEDIENFQKLQMRLIELNSHPNVLNVLGCYKDKLPYRICYEYHPDKTVRDYLYEHFQNLRDSTMSDKQYLKLLCLAHGVANGMLFLKTNNLDHVALRTEKVLYFGATVCKLYDFCLRENSSRSARKLLQEGKALPWLAPEVILCEEYNQWTDNWAFGVLLWELWSGGETPYNKCPRVSLQLCVRNKTLLQRPSNCPTDIYNLMLACWKQNPRGRKKFQEISETITRIKASSCQHIVQDYEDAPFPGPSTYLTLDENEYQQIMPEEMSSTTPI
ncbi:Fibroblast growth factor receptor 4 [Holothuria leucospilota]|uniref:Fibroblast growth factor receptor 4 n=1 Tax=Holothuria leucospilota TaxID=206669 RepID=A0A9Q1BXB5_HOLLE|nr:Fibroblast growth factor receptor 4 [Holothuria leucospilota]